MSSRNSKAEALVSHQLIVFLKMRGTEGAGANGPNQWNTFMMGKGTFTVFCRHVTEAVLSLREEF